MSTSVYRRVGMSILPHFILVGILALLIGAWTRADDGAPETPGTARVEELIKQLGAPGFKERRAARKQLLELGYPAKEALKKHADDPDPEIRIATRKLLQELRWQVIPDAKELIKTLVEELEKGRDARELWETLAKKHREKVLGLLLEVHDEPRFEKGLIIGTMVFLAHALPARTVRHIRAYPKNARRTVIRILDDLALRLPENRNVEARQNLMLILFGLGEDRRAFGQGRLLWLANQSKTALAICMITARRGTLLAGLGEKGGQRIYQQKSARKRCLEVGFYTGLAAELKCPHVVRSLLALSDLEQADPASLQLLTDQLVGLKMTAEASRLLESGLKASNNPALMYQMLYFFNQQFGLSPEKMPAADWQKVLKAASKEHLMHQLAGAVAKYDSIKSEEAYGKVLAMPPDNSGYDASAARTLAWLAGSRGEYHRAADYYEQLLTINQEAHRGRLPFVKKLPSRIEILRRRPELPPESQYAKLLRHGRQAVIRKDHKTAVAKFTQAIKEQPKLPAAYNLLLYAFQDNNDFDNYNSTAAAMLKIKPELPHEILNWAFHASNVMRFAEAVAYADKYIEENSADTRALIARGMAYERQGEYAKTLADYQAAQAKGRSANIYRLLGLLYMKMGKIKLAVENFEEHLLAEPADSYSRIWLFMARTQLGLDDRKALAEFIQTRQPDPKSWPARLLQYCLGKFSDEALLRSARTAKNQWEVNGQLCEASFYIAKLNQARGNRKKAAEFFRKTLEYKITAYIEHAWAQVELERLKEK